MNEVAPYILYTGSSLLEPRDPSKVKDSRLVFLDAVSAGSSRSVKGSIILTGTSSTSSRQLHPTLGKRGRKNGISRLLFYIEGGVRPWFREGLIDGLLGCVNARHPSPYPDPDGQLTCEDSPESKTRIELKHFYDGKLLTPFMLSALETCAEWNNT